MLNQNLLRPKLPLRPHKKSKELRDSDSLATVYHRSEDVRISP